jgi:hypothetical protein
VLFVSQNNLAIPFALQLELQPGPEVGGSDLLAVQSFSLEPLADLVKHPLQGLLFGRLGEVNLCW